MKRMSDVHASYHKGHLCGLQNTLTAADNNVMVVSFLTRRNVKMASRRIPESSHDRFVGVCGRDDERWRGVCARALSECL